MTTSLAIGVLTFRRPEQIAETIPLILEHLDHVTADPSFDVEPFVIVVDNDPAASARSVVEAWPDARVHYAVEAKPGIAAARNRVLDEAAQADVLVFIDDDERPEPDWLAALLRVWADTGAAAVMGRVTSVFETEPEPWVAAGEFFKRRRMPSGTQITVAAAGNLLLDLSQVRTLGVRFDEGIGLSAGEDTLFSHRLVRAGGRIVWCEESNALDLVPESRVTRTWVLDRARSHGNTSVVVQLALATTRRERVVARVRGAVAGMTRAVAGRCRWLIGVVTRSHRHQARGLRTERRGRGMFLAAFGGVVREYARPTD